MKTTYLLSLLVVPVLILGACGATQQDTRAGAPGDDAKSPVSDPNSPVSSTPDPNATLPQGEGRAQRVKPRPGMADLRPVAWEKARQTPSGRSLRVAYWSGVEPCNVLDHVDVEYTATKIVVTLFEGHDPEAGDVACIELALLKAVVVKLDEAVDGRKIVDGAK
jgi:hypothetical protein